MSNARLSQYLRNSTQIRTFRAAFSDATGSTSAGILFELSGAADKKITLRHIQISKPNTAFTPIQIERLSTLSISTGSPTALSPVRVSNPGGSTSLSTLRTFADVPATKGTLLNQIQEIDLSTGEVLNEHYGDEDGGQSVVLNDSTHAIAITMNTTGIIVNGYIEWTEEP